jgi:hypothetical protein
MAICNILWPFSIIYDFWVLFVAICYIFHVLVCLDQEKICQRWIQVNFFRLINQPGFVRTLQKLAAAKEVEEKSFETLGATIAPSHLVSKSSFTKGISATCNAFMGMINVLLINFN